MDAREQPVQERLRQIEPQLAEVHLAWYGHFEGDASSEQLIRYLTKHGYEWANVSRSTMCRWMRKIDQARCDIL